MVQVNTFTGDLMPGPKTQELTAASGSLKRFIPAGNRFQFPRKQSAAAPGFNLFSVRWHLSPPVDIDGFVAAYYAGYQDPLNGLQPIGNDLRIACSLMYPTANSPGAGKSFSKDGIYQVPVKNGSVVYTDRLSMALPANTPYRVRTWVSPGRAIDGVSVAGSATAFTTITPLTFADIGQTIWIPGAGAAGAAFSATISSISSSNAGVLSAAASTTVTQVTGLIGGGYVPYGIPCLGSGNGGSLSGFGGSATDQSAYSSALAESSQGSGNPGNNAANDTSFEPMIYACTARQIRSWALFGDSITYGAIEVGSGGNTTLSGAGDAYGNAGIWPRAIAAKGAIYHNFGISGSILNTWATDGYSNFMLDLGANVCNAAIVALGTNDELSYTSAQILANIQKMVNKLTSLGFQKIVVPTLMPRTTSSNGFADVANQTVDPNRSPVVTAVNAGLLGGQITGATIMDIGSLFADPTVPTKWRADGGVWTPDGTHPSMYAMIQTNAAMTAMLPS